MGENGDYKSKNIANPTISSSLSLLQFKILFASYQNPGRCCPHGINPDIITMYTFNALPFHFLALVATMAIAGPLSDYPTGPNLVVSKRTAETSGDDLPGHIVACNNAENCETYIDNKGYTAIRFKRGTEPGTAEFARRLAKRDDSDPVTTYATLGDGNLLWGCDIDPSVTLGNITTPCMDTGSCDQANPAFVDINYITTNPGGTAGAPTSQTMEITATGEYYPPWFAAYVAAMQALGGVMTNWTDNQAWQGADIAEREAIEPLSIPGAKGTCNVASQSNYFNIARYQGTELDGWMNAQISIPTMVDGLCNDLGPEIIAGAIAGAFPPLGGAMAGIFGIINGACSVVKAGTANESPTKL